MTFRIHPGTRQRALDLLTKIKKQWPDMWREVLRHAGPPPATATGLSGFDLNGSSGVFGGSFSLPGASSGGVTAGDSWLTTAINGASQLLGTYANFKNTTAQNKLQLEQLRNQTEALKAASQPAAAPANSAGDVPALPTDTGSPSTSSNGLLIGGAAAAVLGLLWALNR